MTERNKPDSLQDLDDRLHRLRKQEEAKKPQATGALESRNGLGLAVRIGVEIVAAVGVGAGLGFLLDRWLGTAPWLMVVLFVLGAAAGMMNVYRVMKGMNQAVGYETEKTREDDQPRED